MDKKIFKNKKALHDYEIIEKLEVGIVLEGFEVKSIRSGNINIANSYANFINSELFLQDMHISPYKINQSIDPYRKRKLLLHKKQLLHLQSSVSQKRLTLIPLNLYINEKQKVKVELALCKGLKSYDKRQKESDKQNKKTINQLKRCNKI